MPKFSKISRQKLDTCDPRLIQICEAAIKRMDFAVICGHRDKKAQDEAFKGGFSKLKFPRSKHNKMPSRLTGRISAGSSRSLTSSWMRPRRPGSRSGGVPTGIGMASGRTRSSATGPTSRSMSDQNFVM